MSLYAADGSFNVTVVDGSSYVGLFAVDGSINVIASPDPATTYVGLYHPCGAYWVTLNTSTSEPVSINNIDGSLNISQSPYIGSGQNITVVSGSFGGSTPGDLIPIIIF